MILAIGPRLEGHSVIFLAIQTHLSCRFLLAVDSLGLRRSRSSSQFIDPRQDFPKHIAGASYFRFGSRLCKNADAESFCAIIESGAWLRRIIIAAKAKFRTQYFVLAAKK
jgi:hypothetical protein